MAPGGVDSSHFGCYHKRTVRIEPIIYEGDSHQYQYAINLCVALMGFELMLFIYLQL